MREKRNSIANALELRLSCTNPSNNDKVIYKAQAYPVNHKRKQL